MKPRPPLSEYAKKRIYAGKLAERTLRSLAEELGCSWDSARKWWRVGRKQGESGLEAERISRGAVGALSQYPPELANEAVRLKQLHPGWEANRVRVELRKQDADPTHPLPSRSRLAALFTERCPDCVAQRHARPSAPRPPSKAGGPHEVWGLDSQEAIRLLDGSIATVCSIRNPFADAMIASRAFRVETKRQWRKLTLEKIRQTIRWGIQQWHTLPEIVCTDNELVQAGDLGNQFLSHLTLWQA